MMKLQWAVLLTLGLLTIQANAEEAVVIDAGMVGEVSGAIAVDVNTSSQVDAGNVSQADANRERILKGGKMSARQKHEMAKAELSDSNKQQGEIFLAANKVKQGVVSLASGVQYKVLRAGQGRMPTDTSVVVCRYRATLIDGTEFDKSEAKKSVALSVVAFLPGLKEAVKLMSAGSRWQIVIPPQLAYGELGDRGVGPNAVLIYDMEIISIK
jgi:FKBP-type peptidyl-prolyl cis-trans isomerase FklB